MTVDRISDHPVAGAMHWNAEDCLEEALRRVRQGEMTGAGLLVINVDDLRNPDEFQWLVAQLTQTDSVLLLELVAHMLKEQVLAR